jgi:hypothetical protein
VDAPSYPRSRRASIGGIWSTPNNHGTDLDAIGPTSARKILHGLAKTRWLGQEPTTSFAEASAYSASTATWFTTKWIRYRSIDLDAQVNLLLPVVALEAHTYVPRFHDSSQSERWNRGLHRSCTDQR